mmetsp:Transcript_35160/g.34832  ORF Transcript_35160/g.34832 Transcript_35160/m.34832 type:complete len:106 (+) Transcript_35160:19-336(+)
MSLKNYRIGKTIGRGTFGIVKLAYDEVNKRKVAIKVMNSSQFKTGKEVKRVKTEVRISKMMNHPNIIKTHEVFEEKGRIFIVMEYCSKGDLFDYIKQKKKLPESE